MTVKMFELPPDLVADAPIEASGRRRDEARLMVARRAGPELVDTTFADLPQFLRSGDVLVVNTSATLPAAVPTLDGRLLHLSTHVANDMWIVELRCPCGEGSRPYFDGHAGEVVRLAHDGYAQLLMPYPASSSVNRLWTARLHVTRGLRAFLNAHAKPIRYGCTDTAWPLDVYQTVFADEPGSAEMPSAARAFTPELVVALVRRGVVFAPIVLHTGVSSQDAGEPPYPERYRVPQSTADLINARSGRIIAVGTTATRAVETAVDAAGHVRAAAGWTDLVITPDGGVRVVDGLITGWHPPEASHLQLLEAVAGRDALGRAYAHAVRERYRWHEFGDTLLVLP